MGDQVQELKLVCEERRATQEATLGGFGWILRSKEVCQLNFTNAFHKLVQDWNVISESNVLGVIKSAHLRHRTIVDVFCREKKVACELERRGCI